MKRQALSDADDDDDEDDEDFESWEYSLSSSSAVVSEVIED